MEAHIRLRKTLFSRKHNLKLGRGAKIAFISDAVYPYNKGGKEKRLYDITTRLAQAGYEVTIYTMKWWQGYDEVVHEGVKMRAICPYYKLYSGKRRSLRQAKLFGVSCLKMFIEDFDVVDVDEIPFYPLFFMKIVCAIRGKRMYATWHEVWGRDYWQEYLGWKGYFGYLLEKFSSGFPDMIIATSEHTKKRIGEVLGRRNNVVVVTPGVDMEKIAMARLSKERYDIVFAGRLLSHKNVDMLIRAVAEIARTDQSVRCLIVGEGPEKENLVNLANRSFIKNIDYYEGKNSDNIFFKDFFEDDMELYACFKSARVFVTPSNREGFGLTAIEANACGIPVVTTNEKGNALRKYIKNGKNGILCESNADSLREAILEAMRNGSKWHLGCIEAAKEFHWGNIIDRLKPIYGI